MPGALDGVARREASLSKYRWNGDRIREFRSERGWSQDRLVKELFSVEGVDVTRQTVSSWENGLTSPDGNQIAALARLLGVVPSAFFK